MAIAATAAAGLTTPATTANGRIVDAGTGLGNDINTFLRLLTTQLQNQDPTNPLDANQFTQQLVQFSSVEQQIQTNKTLTTLAGNLKASAAASAVSFLGRTVTVEGATSTMIGGNAEWTYTLGDDATESTITVTDSTGQVVYTGSGAGEGGSHEFTWDGRDMNGNRRTSGDFTLRVTAKDVNGRAVGTTTTMVGMIEGLDYQGAEPRLSIQGRMVPLSAILAVLPDPPAGGAGSGAGNG